MDKLYRDFRGWAIGRNIVLRSSFTEKISLESIWNTASITSETNWLRKRSRRIIIHRRLLITETSKGNTTSRYGFSSIYNTMKYQLLTQAGRQLGLRTNGEDGPIS